MIPAIYTYILVHPLARARDKTDSLPRGPPWHHRRWRQIHHAITPDNRTSDNGGPTLQHTFPPYRGPQAQPHRRGTIVTHVRAKLMGGTGVGSLAFIFDILVH